MIRTWARLAASMLLLGLALVDVMNGHYGVAALEALTALVLAEVRP